MFYTVTILFKKIQDILNVHSLKTHPNWNIPFWKLYVKGNKYSIRIWFGSNAPSITLIKKVQTKHVLAAKNNNPYIDVH
jgi:hypothetical protein